MGPEAVEYDGLASTCSVCAKVSTPAGDLVSSCKGDCGLDLPLLTLPRVDPLELVSNVVDDDLEIGGLVLAAIVAAAVACESSDVGALSPTNSCSSHEGALE